jgi:hypothetical protein
VLYSRVEETRCFLRSFYCRNVGSSADCRRCSVNKDVIPQTEPRHCSRDRSSRTRLRLFSRGSLICVRSLSRTRQFKAPISASLWSCTTVMFGGPGVVLRRRMKQEKGGPGVATATKLLVFYLVFPFPLRSHVTQACKRQKCLWYHSALLHWLRNAGAVKVMAGPPCATQQTECRKGSSVAVPPPGLIANVEGGGSQWKVNNY